MRIIARLFVMWLIAVALPIQGVAAATMLHCGVANDHRPAAASGMHEHHHSAMHSHADAVVGDLHQHVHHHTSTKTAGADAAAHQHADGQTGCSVCASCCGVAALPVMPLVLPAQDLAETAVAVHSLPVAVFLTDGPERPPRTILA
jgi:hypothetical protein